ncbi:flippase [Patescibacteria group bacterium]|nr:flippase [Patescibacteria group bacterium]MBU4458897.1 flippase [Patescibacteria group bacterium]MCG2696179.1 flippase [Candidatus Portnoybacteria bacterium]
MTVVRKIAYNTVISAGARLIGVALSLVSLGLIARYLGTEGFGNYSLILAFLYTFNNIADLGLYSLMVREISKPDADEKKIASNIFTIRLVAVLVFMAVASIIIWFFPYSSQVKNGTLIAAVSFIFLSMGQVLMGIFQKYLRTDRSAVADILGRVAQLGLIILFIKISSGLFGIVFALIGGCFVNFILLFIFARKYVLFSLDFDFSYWRKIIKSALPIAVSIVLTLIYFKIDSIFLSLSAINRHSPNPISDVGVYGIAYKILEGLIFFPAMFVGLIMPLLSNSAFTDPKKFKKIFQKATDILIIFIIPLIIGLLMLSLPIVVLIGGTDFSASAPVLNVLAFAIGLIFLGNLFGNGIIALNRQKAGAWIYFIGMIFNIILNLIYIPKYRYVGAAATTMATEFLVTILMMILIYKTIHYLPKFNVIKPLIAGAIMAGFLYSFSSWNIFILTGGGLIVYLLVLYLIKGIRKEEVQLLIKEEV